MKLSWIDGRGARQSARVPPRIQLFSDVIGMDATATMLLALGGASIYIPSTRPEPENLLIKAVGAEAAMALGRAMGGDMMRVPLAPAFLAQYLRGRGETVRAIARRLLRTDVTIRKYLQGDPPDDAEAAKRWSKRQAEIERFAQGHLDKRPVDAPLAEDRT